MGTAHDTCGVLLSWVRTNVDISYLVQTHSAIKFTYKERLVEPTILLNTLNLWWWNSLPKKFGRPTGFAWPVLRDLKHKQPLGDSGIEHGLGMKIPKNSPQSERYGQYCSHKSCELWPCVLPENLKIWSTTVTNQQQNDILTCAPRQANIASVQALINNFGIIIIIIICESQQRLRLEKPQRASPPIIAHTIETY